MTEKDLEYINSQTKKDFEQVKVSVEVRTAHDNSEVLEAISQFSPVDGWVSLQSTSAKRVTGTEIDCKGEGIIACEFCDSAGRSLSVRFTDDAWAIYVVEEKDSDDAVCVLKTKAHQLTKIGTHTYIDYNIYYLFEPELGYRPFVSSFAGFSEARK